MRGSVDPGATGPPQLVSVIVPVFDGERYLAEALDSVLAQDHRPLEVIVVDDGSTDRSAEVARSFAGVEVIGLEENLGPAAARNAGLERATGSFITFLDADDLMVPDRISTQLAYLSAHPDVGCVLMHQELLLEAGAAHPVWRPNGPIGIPPTTALIRREDSDRVRGFDPSYRVTEDTDWLFRLREAGVRIDVLGEVGVIRRIHQRNLTYGIETMRSELARSVRGKA